MKLSKLLFIFLFLISFSVYAQPSDAQIISQMKGKNPNITKVVISGREKRTEGGTSKTYVFYAAHIKTKYPGVTRVYTSQKRYIGNSFDKDLVGSSYYLGMKNPSIETCQEILNKNKQGFYGNDYKNIVGIIEEITVVPDNKFYWGTLNSTSFLVSATYLYRTTAYDPKFQTIKVVKRVSMSRIAEGGKYDPQADILPNGIWEFKFAKKISKEKLKEETYSKEQMAGLKSLQMLDDIERANNYIANLPVVELPVFKTDKHVIKFLHDLLIEGDKGKIEAALNQLAPDDYFADRASYLYTQQGAKFLDDIVAYADWYNSKYCKNPQIKSEKYGEVSFFTRDLKGYGAIRVYQKKDLTWRLHSVRSPLYKESAGNKDDRAASAKAAGDSNCGEPLNIEVPIGPVKYAIGDRIEGLSRGTWYAGTVGQIDNMMDDRYYVKFDKINGTWITADQMRVPTNDGGEETDIEKGEDKADVKKIEPKKVVSKDAEKPSIKKSSKKLNSLKGKIKLP